MIGVNNGSYLILLIELLVLYKITGTIFYFVIYLSVDILEIKIFFWILGFRYLDFFLPILPSLLKV